MEYEKFEKNKYDFADIPSMLVVGGNTESNRSRELASFLKELEQYKILINDLSNCKLKESQRNMALNIAYYISNNEELSRRTKNKKDLLMNKIPKLIRIKPVQIDKLRDYILAYYIILSNERYKWIRDYFKIIESENNKKDKAQKEPTIIVNKSTEIYRGIVIKSIGTKAYILTSMGEFLEIKVSEKVNVGEICAGKEKIGLKKYKIHIASFLLILMFIAGGLYVQYNKTQTIVVIETTSSIKININSFDKVIYMHSPTEKGSNLISAVNGINKDVDEVIKNVFEYALDNGMIDISTKTLITSSGKALKYGLLVETNKFIKEHKIPIIINNAGNEHKLPKVEE